MNHSGQFIQPPPPPHSSLGGTQKSDGEILETIATLGDAIAKCEFIAQELVARLGPVLVPSHPSQTTGMTPEPLPETLVAQRVQDHIQRVRALMYSINDATNRLALP
ncbi:hypothetical protein [Achromobacter aegrifaciens]|uniref:hypothetical protein n=1 Tax=Achromobacter aegrifaciens TaxID=1287736 RepID=UPI000F747F3F|nr:hypothetical protein [Achromobacter aegrifaciens]RSE90779.1 hypothetical protein EGU54_32305 [Achromobacter aegrifaciens]